MEREGQHACVRAGVRLKSLSPLPCRSAAHLWNVCAYMFKRLRLSVCVQAWLLMYEDHFHTKVVAACVAFKLNGEP